MTHAFSEGQHSYTIGQPVDANPYDMDKKPLQHYDWNDGWETKWYKSRPKVRNEMTIDLKYLIPIFAPFVMLGLLRVLFFIAGAGWSNPETAATVSAVMGSIIGVMVCGALDINEICWRVKIGDKK
jgi:hypothetical protein